MARRLQVKSNGMFANWPVIQYNGQNIQKVTTKITMPDFLKNNTTVFFNYTIQHHQTRPDHVARDYYGDPKLDWIILFINRTVDPAFEWPMNQQAFNQYIIDKYGSVANAQSTVINYQQLDTQSDITAAYYEVLPDVQKKYWIPLYDYLGNIKHYRYDDQNYQLSAEGYDALSNEEKQYFAEVDAYDYEVKRNDQNRIIRLLHSKYVDSFLSEYRKTLNA